MVPGVEKPKSACNGKNPIKQIHDQLNRQAKPYLQMYNFFNNKRNSDEKSKEDDEKDLLDPEILNKLIYTQRTEKKQWQGIKIEHVGIPGTTSLESNDRVLLFNQEKLEIQAEQVVLEIFKELYEATVGSILANSTKD